MIYNTPQGMAFEHAVEERISEIDALLLSGVDSVTVDGTTTKINHATLRTERARLERLHTGGHTRRPLFTRIRTSGG